MGRKSKSKRKQAAAVEDDRPASEREPRSFVFERSGLDRQAAQLLLDVRRVMEPHTASKLRARKTNSLKDFVSVAGSLHITHFLLFSRSDTGLNFLVLNNFNKEDNSFKLMSQVLQNMFPSINVATVDVSTIRRVVLFNYDDDSKTIEFRHYDIAVKPVGISRSVKAVLTSKLPDLSQFQDISDFVLKNSANYDSDAELAADNRVTLPKDAAAGKEAWQSAVRLTELGPRMTLTLIKIEEGLCEGKTLYHQYIHRTPEEEAEMERERHRRQMLKLRRKQEQERNVTQKAKDKEARKQKQLAGMAREQEDGEDGENGENGEEEEEEESGNQARKKSKRSVEEDVGDDVEDDDDAAYYRQELGEEPPQELGLGASNPAPLKLNKSAAPVGFARKRDGARRGGGGGDQDKDAKGQQPKQKRSKKAPAPAPPAKKMSKRDVRSAAKRKVQSQRDRKRNQREGMQ